MMKNKKKRKKKKILKLKYFDKPPEKKIPLFNESFFLDEGITPNANSFKIKKKRFIKK
jgi:hypothetical protein